MLTDAQYTERVSRNAGFLSPHEQDRLRVGSVFVCGVGGMGGTAAVALARAGVGRLHLADLDRFEASNMNRQLLADRSTIGELKTDVTRRAIHAIDPGIDVEVWSAEWLDHLGTILAECPVVINAMDDPLATIRLYRAARDRGATVIDAYTAPLPSVTVVAPTDPRPEERLGFPTRGRVWPDITSADLREAQRMEIEYVLAHSSSLERFDPVIAADFIAGRRGRSSFAPVVFIAGSLMAAEAINLVAGRAPGTDCDGYFFDPWASCTERRRRGPVAWLARLLARRGLRRLSGEAA